MATYNGKSIPTNGSKNIITWSEEQKSDLENAFNSLDSIVQALTILSPVTGSIKAVKQGNIVHLKGTVTLSANGDRIANTGSIYAPGGSDILYIPLAYGAYLRVTTQGAIFGYSGSGGMTIYLSGVSYYSE